MSARDKGNARATEAKTVDVDASGDDGKMWIALFFGGCGFE